MSLISRRFSAQLCVWALCRTRSLSCLRLRPVQFAVWAMPMAERGKLQHGIIFRFVGAFELQRPCFLEKTVKRTVVTGRDSRLAGDRDVKHVSGMRDVDRGARVPRA